MLAPDFIHTTLDNIFVLKTPVLEKLLRPVLVYLALIVLLRIFGKRELAQLNPFDLVVLLSVSNTVQNAIIGDDNSLTGGLLGATALFAINYLVVRFLFRHRRLDQILEGSPTTLIQGGEVVRDALAKELLSESELMTVVRRQGFDELADIEECVLQPGGVFFVKGHMPTTDQTRYEAIMKRLDQLDKKLTALSINPS